MSTSSVRRLKERSGVGGGVGWKVPTAAISTATAKPYKALNPVSDKVTGGENLKKSTGKENPRPTSRVRAAAMSQKLVMRPMPRIDKSSACSGDGGSEARDRRSTSSVPRGRSSSPSEFNRALSDLRKNRVSRVSLDRCDSRGGELERSVLSGGKLVSGVRGLERIQQKKGAFRDSNVKTRERSEIGDRVLNVLRSKGENSEIRKEMDVKSEKGENLRIRVIDECKGDAKSSSVSKSSSGSCISESSLESSVKVLDSKRVVEKNVKCIDSGNELGRKSLSNLRSSENLKQNVVNGEGMGAQGVSKYPSKLHEKIANLEENLKRISSDVMRTKEMVDMNNTRDSKAAISDIQEKISVIEKAMANVVIRDDNADAYRAIQNDDDQIEKVSEGCTNKQAGQLKGSVRDLKSEELEARFFPHHKLLRDRTSLKSLMGSSQSHQTDSLAPTNEIKPEEKLLSPVDENPIALEFLASLNKESKVTIRDGQDGLQPCEIQEMDGSATSGVEKSSFNGKSDVELILTTNETLDEFDDQENRPSMIFEEEFEDSCVYQLNEIGHKASTGGWFVSEGESVLLAHNDGSCSFYDIANCEGKAEYKPPVGVSPNIWRDCWLIRAPSADGCSGRYVVAASAGNTMDSGFCSWDFYTKDVRAFHTEDGNSTSRTALAPLSNNTVQRRNVLSTTLAPENQQWWYRPCGPLIVSTASSQRVVRVYDIRDGEQIMNWEVQKPVLAMDHSSPLQWRNRGKVVVAETESISVWDVSSLSSQSLMSISSLGRKISTLHVNNTDSELGGGVRQRVSSSEAEGNDGVFCTPDSINVLDFRHPSGVGLKIPKLGVNAHSVFSRSDSIYIGCTNTRSAGKKQPSSQVQHFSLRKQRLVSTYSLPESNAHSHFTDITQVWGNSNFVMGVCGLGLFVFDAMKDDILQPFGIGYGDTQKVREVIGPDDLYSPSFDYLGSRVLLISKDRPALWRYLL